MLQWTERKERKTRSSLLPKLVGENQRAPAAKGTTWRLILKREAGKIVCLPREVHFSIFPFHLFLLPFSVSSLTSSSRKIGQALHKHWRGGGVTDVENWRESGGWGRVEIDGNAMRRMGKHALSPPHSPSPVLSGMRPAESRLCLTRLRVRLSHWILNPLIALD